MPAASMPADGAAWRSRSAEWLLAAAVGAGLAWASGLLVPPWPTAFEGHGQAFAAMAAHPFAGTGDFPQRVLWPLLACIAGAVGVSPPQFSQVCNAALLAVVFWFARRRAGCVLDALLATAAIAASGTVLVYNRMACFSDTLNLLLLVLLVHFAARPFVFWALVGVSALSHELVFFFAPWLVYLRSENGGRWTGELLSLAVVSALYALFRAPLQSRYGIAYYLEHNFWVPWGLPALWALWAFVVLVEFGPLLVPAIAAWRRGELAERTALGGRWGPCLYLAGLLPLMLLAYDVMRFATFVFLPVLLGCLALLRRPGGRWLVFGLTALACASYAWLHPVASEQGGRHFTEVSGHVLAPDMVPLLVARTPGDGLAYTVELLRRTWPIAAGGAIGGAVVLAFGLWLAGRRGASPAATG